jgi:two-component system response regulator MtrA
MKIGPQPAPHPKPLLGRNRLRVTTNRAWGATKLHTTSLEHRILIAQDDPNTSALLSLSLPREGFSCVFAQDGRETVELAAKNRLSLIVLDVVRSDVRDWEICRRVRGVTNVPILILSARSDAGDIVKGLTLGADDYVVKPFRLPELIARIKALLRRTRVPAAPQTLSHGDLTFDLSRRSVTRKGQRVTLTSSELRILETLMSAPGRIFPRRELLTCLYPSGGVVIERVIDVHVQKLRAKIEDERARPRYILTERGLGYRFADSVESDASTIPPQGQDETLS